MNGYCNDWREIAKGVKDLAGWRCIRCGHPHDLDNGYMLTVHHMDKDPGNNEEKNLVALCQRCHLHVGSFPGGFWEVQLPMFEPEAWIAGHLRRYYKDGSKTEGGEPDGF